ncbi:MAG: hypothetical protein JO115_18120 [Pseudonocardiales bacterium]|nr:hypothetical protein [Pseudonocardiales bacterium]
MGGAGGTGVGNEALRALLEEAQISNAGLARAVISAAAREGTHLGTNATSVRRMLSGAQPRHPVPRLIATVLSRRLERQVRVTDCGFIDQEPTGEDPYDGLTCSGTLEGTLRTVVELSERDMRRRKLLLGSAFSVPAFAEPMVIALLVPPAQVRARAAGQRVGMADVQVLTEQVDHLIRLGFQFGSGRVREQAVALLNRQANQLLHGSYSEKIGTALLSGVAQVTRLAGFMAGDTGRDALAQRYYIQALDLAMRAGDRRYAAFGLATMSRMTVRIGENLPTEQDTVRHGRQAVALARAGLTITQGTATPALAAELHALEARGLALLGETYAARQAALSAERRYELVRPGDEPPWRLFYSESSLTADVAVCLRGIGETQQAITLGTTALQAVAPWKVRGRCIDQLDLALTHLRGRDWEQAVAYGRDALRSATDVTSTMITQRLRTLHRHLQPLRANSPHLRELDERLTTYFTHSARHH